VRADADVPVDPFRQVVSQLHVAVHLPCAEPVEEAPVRVGPGQYFSGIAASAPALVGEDLLRPGAGRRRPPPPPGRTPFATADTTTAIAPRRAAGNEKPSGFQTTPPSGETEDPPVTRRRIWGLRSRPAVPTDTSPPPTGSPARRREGPRAREPTRPRGRQSFLRSRQFLHGRRESGVWMVPVVTLHDAPAVPYFTGGDPLRDS
jgi:hypothetical protein